jgi:uncharacterized membrane protein YgdD (TMEM256/DUF423 family)
MIWARLGAIFMFLAVALGAFGAHGLRGRLDASMMDIYKTAVLYHMIHALALFATAWVVTPDTTSKANLSGWFFTAGIFLFSGSLYLLSVTGIRWLGAITPIGGVCFLVGWVILALSLREA